MERVRRPRPNIVAVSPPAGSRRPRRRAARRRDHREPRTASQRAASALAPASSSSGAVARARARSPPGSAAGARAAARSGRARASGPPARRRACRRPRCPTSASSQDARAAPAAPAHGDGPSSRIANAGTATISTATRKPNSTVALATNSAVRSTGREQEAVEAALLALGHEQPVDPEHGGEQQRHPQHAGRQVAAERRRGRGAKWKSTNVVSENSDHRRHRLAACAARAAGPCAGTARSPPRLTRTAPRIVGRVDRVGAGRAARRARPAGRGRGRPRRARLDVVAR